MKLSTALIFLSLFFLTSCGSIQIVKNETYCKRTLSSDVDMCLFVQGITTCPSSYEAAPSCDTSLYDSKCTGFRAGGYAATLYFKYTGDDLNGILDARAECRDKADGDFSSTI